jgi:predicted RNA-binding protein with PUA-like domain
VTEVAYWLLKTEPEAWSWDDQKKRGSKGEPWSGVRNYQAANNMKAMKRGDLAFFYHSGEERRIVGVVEVVKEYRPDPTDESGRFGMVDVKAVKPLPKPVTLAEIRSDERLAEMVLVKNSRLSVQPVSAGEWQIICRAGGAV